MEKLPLEVLSYVKSTRNFVSFLMALNGGIVLYVLLVASFTEGYVAQPVIFFYVLLAGFYAVAYTKLNQGIKDRSVSQGWLAAVNLVSLIYVISIVGILIVFQLFRNSRNVARYKEKGQEAFSTDDEWEVKNSSEWSAQKSLALSLIAGLLLGVMAGVAAFANSEVDQIKLQAQMPEKSIAQQLVDEANTGSSYPEDIGDGITIDSINMQGDDMSIRYTFSGVDSRNVDIEFVDNTNIESMCNDQGMRGALNAGHRILLSHYFTVSNDTHVSTVSKADCTSAGL